MESLLSRLQKSVLNQRGNWAGRDDLVTGITLWIEHTYDVTVASGRRSRDSTCSVGLDAGPKVRWR